MDKNLIELHNAYNKHVWVEAPNEIAGRGTSTQPSYDLLQCSCGCYALRWWDRMEPMHNALISRSKHVAGLDNIKALYEYARLFSTPEGIKRYIKPLEICLRKTVRSTSIAGIEHFTGHKRIAREVLPVLRQAIASYKRADKEKAHG